MRLNVAYGTAGLAVDVPDDAVVVEPKEPAALADEAGAVRQSLRHPVSGPALGEVVDRDGTVAVVFPDLTRPMPNTTVLPPLLAELELAGAGPDRVILLCATGTHRQATPAEMEELVGPQIAGRYRIHDHASDDGLHVRVGEVDGTPVLLDRHYVEAAVRIVTGFVEPHFFAGWSGGPKGVCPGLADTATILEAHSPARLADARATWMITSGNPVHEFVDAAAALCPPDLSVDVTIDGRRRLTGVFAGALPDSHRAACGFAADTVTQPVAGHFDVVLTTNGGYPLDRNLYQAVKGMAAAERVVAPGGIIVMAAACDDGLPDDGAFARILRDASGPAELVRPRGPGQLDAWQAQVLGRVLGRAEVWLFSEGLSDDAVRSAMLSPVHDPSAAVARALDRKGPGARLCVLPHGPLTVATSSGSTPAG
ncbi:MAG: nickel-dependent lactate racemase [Acidimicrobiales bacterium]